MRRAESLTCVRIWAVLGCVVLFLFLASPSQAQNIVDDWQSVRLPPAPELKPVTLDPKTTGLLLLDFNRQTCNPERRPRCVGSIPQVERLLKDARDKSVHVIYTLSAGANPADIAKELAPMAGEPVISSGPDKFLGTDLERILREKEVKTVIAVGTAAHGAVLYTASGAALRGLQVVIPVDGISAETLFAEQSAVWTLSNAPRISNQVTLTKSDMIRWGAQP